MHGQTVTLPLSGMTCVNCAMNIERSVKKLPGVNGSSVNFAAEQANVSFDPGQRHLTGIPRAIEISRRTMRTVRQNLFLAFCYNTVLIPVAAGVLVPFIFMPDFLRQLHPILPRWPWRSAASPW